jgi:hypothetical protein
VSPAQAIFQAQPEAMDMQQRLRAAADTMVRDLTMVGAGAYVGSTSGGLIGTFAPVIPRKIGWAGADGSTVARGDAVTITYVPTTYAQSTTSAALPQAAGLTVNNVPGCPWGQSVCGFQTGMTVAVFDSTAHFDVFTISGVQSGAAQVQAHNPAMTYIYPAGARVAQVESHSYYLDAANSQLRQYDGYQTDVPVVDNVVGLSVEYFGDPSPPVRPRPPAGADNCLYDAAGNEKFLPALAGPPDGLVPLPLTMFSDGPWCGSGGTQYDADLLRVRAVRVTLRVQAALSAFRASGPAFLKPGSSRASGRYLPDLAATFDVSPRNLNIGR